MTRLRDFGGCPNFSERRGKTSVKSLLSIPLIYRTFAIERAAVSGGTLLANTSFVQHQYSFNINVLWERRFSSLSRKVT